MLEDREHIADVEMYRYFNKPVKIIGCGGAGINIVNYLSSIKVFGADTIAIDTDERHLSVINADKKVLIGASVVNGNGAKGNTGAGESSANDALYALHQTFLQSKLIFIVAGMGGGTGTGAAPVIAKAAREYGLTVVAIVSIPFRDEPDKRAKAEQGILKLLSAADTVIPVDFERLPDYERSLPRENALLCMDELISGKLKTLIEAMTKRPLVHVNILDLKNIMKNGGLGVMLIGEMGCDNYILDIMGGNIGYPVIDVDYHQAKRAFIHVTCGRDIDINEALDIVENTYRRFNPDIDTLWGAKVEEDFVHTLKILTILIGIDGYGTIKK